jgi:hypothetical protein
LPAVLITIQDGAVDYVTDDRDIQVVIVDFDQYDPDTSFPDDVEATMREVMELPFDMPWRGGVLKRLQEVKRTIQTALVSGPGYAKEGNYHGNTPAVKVPGSDARRERQPQAS